MKKFSMIITIATLLLSYFFVAQAQVYKVVDKDGNMTYTDQAPQDGSGPMNLPEISVIKTVPTAPAATVTADEAEVIIPPTPRQLRKIYRDFSITRPAQQETFWGTENKVVVSWTSKLQLQPQMSVRLFVDGVARATTQSSFAVLALERGEHKVHAELLDERGRRLIDTELITFFVKQNSVRTNLNNRLNNRRRPNG